MEFEIDLNFTPRLTWIQFCKRASHSIPTIFQLCRRKNSYEWTSHEVAIWLGRVDAGFEQYYDQNHVLAPLSIFELFL